MSLLHKDTDALLRENIRLAKENNKLLHKMWRAQVINFWARILIMAIVIGVPVYLYRVYVSDYMVQLQETYTQLKENATLIIAPETRVIPEVIQRFTGGGQADVE